MQASSSIWFNGRLVPWDECRVHVLSHGLHYGSSVFEGIRVYATTEGVAIFRLREHMRRLLLSAKIHRIEIPFSEAALCEAAVQLIKENQVANAYIRPIAFLGYGSLALDPRGECPIDVALAVFSFDRYLTDDSARGVDVCVSSWTRAAANTHPALAKAGGNYLSSRLATIEAHDHGYAEALMLDPHGHVSEGAGENLFLLHQGRLLTPPLSAGILPGITRDSVIVIARDAGIEVAEQALPRELLYAADEIFLTGTATEIAPVRSVDRRLVGDGERGPVTTKIQSAFEQITRTGSDKFGWLSFVR